MVSQIFSPERWRQVEGFAFQDLTPATAEEFMRDFVLVNLKKAAVELFSVVKPDTERRAGFIFSRHLKLA